MRRTLCNFVPAMWPGCAFVWRSVTSRIIPKSDAKQSLKDFCLWSGRGIGCHFPFRNEKVVRSSGCLVHMQDSSLFCLNRVTMVIPSSLPEIEITKKSHPLVSWCNTHLESQFLFRSGQYPPKNTPGPIATFHAHSAAQFHVGIVYFVAQKKNIGSENDDTYYSQLEERQVVNLN